MATDVAVTIHASSGDYYAKTHEWVKGSDGGNAYAQVVLDENITANLIGTGNNGKYYQDWRFYTNGSDAGSFSIDAAEGYELQSVTFTYATQNNGALYMGETQLTSQTAVAVSGQQAVFQCKNTNDATNGQVRLTAIAVTYQEAVAPLATVKTVYCKNVQSWWNADGAAVAVYAWTGDVKNAAWPGVRMEAVTGEEGIWKADIDTAKYAKIIFTRVNATGDIADWGAKTADLTIPADKDLYTITSTTPVWGNPGVTGEWSVYGEEPTPVDPPTPTAKFYVTGNAALVGQDKEWNPAAVASMADTLELNLEANIDYVLKVTLNGAWEGENNVKGYNELTEKTAGLLDISNDHNIGFKLNEAGVVKVVYIAAANEQPEVFKLIGDFYVAPPADPTVAVIGDMTEWEAQLPFELSEDKTYATLSNDNIKKGTYAFKLIVNGEWRSNGYEYHREFPGAAGITGNAEANMTVNIDVEGAYTFVWTFANDSFAIVYPEKPEPQLANGYYLVGSMNDWTPAAEYFLEQNPDNEAEYELDINLNVNDEIKVVYVENDAIVTWYPKEGNYIVDDNHDGATTMYFRPEYNSDWSAFGGYFYIVPTSTVGFDNVDADAKAIKQVINGKLFILRGDKTYTVDGQIVR